MVEPTEEFKILIAQVAILHRAEPLLYVSCAADEQLETSTEQALLEHHVAIFTHPIHFYDVVIFMDLLAGVLAIPLGYQPFLADSGDFQATTISQEPQPNQGALDSGDIHHILHEGEC